MIKFYLSLFLTACFAYDIVPNPEDPYTYSNFQDVYTTHMRFDLNVDFEH
jgi:hypothetical protein